MKFTNDLGSDNIKGLVWTLAVPSMLSQLVSVLYSIVDRMYIGNIPSNGTQALAGVGVCGPIVTLISSFAFLVGIGGAPLVSINLGEKNIDAAKKVIANCFVYILSLAVPVTVLAYIFRRPILLTFGATEAVYPYAETYFSLYLIGTVFALTATGMNQFIITQGHSRSGMFSVLIGAIINIVLDPIFIFALHMGVAGAAIATVISRYVELAIVAGWTHSHKARNAFIVGAYRSMYIPGKLLRSITIKGMPLLVNEFLWSSGMAVLNQCYSTCGLDVVPAMNICSTLFNLGSVVYLSMGNSVGIIMGQMLGAGHSEEDVRDTNRKLIAVSIASGVVFGGLMAAVSEAFPGIYNTTDAVRHLAAQLIWISAVMMPFGSYLNATYFTLRSGGQTFVTFLFDSCFMWVFCVPLAFCLSRFTNLPILPLYAICQATDFIKCVIGTVMLKQGKWIQNLTV